MRRGIAARAEPLSISIPPSSGEEKGDACGGEKKGTSGDANSDSLRGSEMSWSRPIIKPSRKWLSRCLACDRSAYEVRPKPRAYLTQLELPQK